MVRLMRLVEFGQSIILCLRRGSDRGVTSKVGVSGGKQDVPFHHHHHLFFSITSFFFFSLFDLFFFA